jgi:ABC-type multidrug transport system permease subunit
MKNALLKIGIAFQLIGLICFLTFWLMYFAIAFFVIGTVLISVSRRKWYIFILAISPVLFVIGIVINALYFEKYIIPANFRGVVYILTDEKRGIDREYNFFSRIYRIPQSGILLTKFNQKSGINNRSFFQIDKNGTLKELGILALFPFFDKKSKGLSSP